MSLTSALGTARSALLNTSRQTSVVAQNISNAHDPNYARRIAATVSLAPGARAVGVTRLADDTLFRQNLSALSAFTGQNILMNNMNRLGMSVNGPDNETSPARMIGRLQEALQLYSASPSNRILAESAIDAAQDVATALNNSTREVQAIRADMDSQIAVAVGELNTLLGDFEKVNIEIVNGTRVGRDISDALDQRDKLLKQMSQYISISTMTRGDNDMVIMTGDGATLFETVPRAVTFDPTPVYFAGTQGNPIRIDGVPVKAGTGSNTTASGKIAAMMQIRDDVAVKMQAQLDEMARGLIHIFSEDVGIAGLFEAPDLGYPGGALVDGLAGNIRVNPDYNPQAGGNAEALRDGATGNLNPSGGSSYSGQIIAYLDLLDQPFAFDPAAGLTSNTSLSDFSTNAIGWLEAGRQAAFSAVENKEALLVRTETALSNAVGVNIDQEMAMLLDLEHSYAASARLLQAVDEMLAALMNAVR
jgi:flagellar hook-associated protein 1 FlgK